MFGHLVVHDIAQVTVIDAVLECKRFVSSAKPRQLGSWCHELGIAAIEADQKSREHKDAGIARIPEVR